MGVAAEQLAFAADDEGALAVRFVSDESVNDVDAGFFKLLGVFAIARGGSPRPIDDFLKGKGSLTIPANKTGKGKILRLLCFS